MSFRTSILLAITAVSAGCGGMPMEQCIGQDWYSLGYADASSGHGTQQFLAYHNSCVLHGITPHRTDYLSGWVDGRESVES